ncbi:MAG: hypothetical protein BYD32DRAFT_439709 [Podila humilis]|nr:MAG: hypothetical protein BYD32DRAFT_439709 [Podila humilis]
MATSNPLDRDTSQLIYLMGNEKVFWLPTQICTETGKRFILLDDIKKAFVGVKYPQGPQNGTAVFMIDNNGDLYCPLRIVHRSHILLVMDETSREDMNEQQFISELYPPETFPYLATVNLYQACVHLHECLAAFSHDRETFQQRAANSRYYNSLFREESEILEDDFLGKDDREKKLASLSELEKQVPKWNYSNMCWNLLQFRENNWDSVTSALFIVLPSDLVSWDDSDPLTHQFRLYFLCDFWERKTDPVKKGRSKDLFEDFDMKGFIQDTLDDGDALKHYLMQEEVQGLGGEENDARNTLQGHNAQDVPTSILANDVFRQMFIQDELQCHDNEENSEKDTLQGQDAQDVHQTVFPDDIFRDFFAQEEPQSYESENDSSKDSLQGPNAQDVPRSVFPNGFFNPYMFQDDQQDYDSKDDVDNNSLQDRNAYDIPQHIHFSDHRGYNIERPQEFFQIYGDYVLAMLEMLKRGYEDAVPPLDTFEILWNSGSKTGGHLTPDTIEPLVNKTIEHLQGKFSTTRMKSRTMMGGQDAAIRTYLEVPDGDTAEGNLHRFIGRDQVVRWRCQEHICQQSNKKPLQKLERFIYDHKGDINMRQSTLSVELGSTEEMFQFLSILETAKHIFDISVKLDWTIGIFDVHMLFDRVSKTNALALVVDGVTVDVYPEGHDIQQRNMFGDYLLDESKLRFITLLNYPRPRQQCLIFKNISVRSATSPARYPYGWVQLRSDLENFRDRVSEAKILSDCTMAVSELYSKLGQHGLSSATAVTLFNYQDLSWSATFDLQNHACVEVNSRGMTFPNGLLGPSLRTLKLYLRDTDFDQNDFSKAMQAIDGLHELEVSYHGHSMLYNLEHLVRKWHCLPTSISLTQLNRMADPDTRLTIKRANNDPVRTNALSAPRHDTGSSIFRQEAMGMPMDIEILQWDCDEIFSQLSDFSASILNLAMQRQTSNLIMFTLDVSQLSTVGLASVEAAFHQARLEHLYIVCMPIRSSKSDSIAKILDSIPWHTLRSLVLSGNNLNDWLQLWSAPIDSQLLNLTVRGTRSELRKLSHASALMLHQLIYTNPLVELHLLNFQLLDKRDWVLVIDGIDLFLLQTLHLVEYRHEKFSPMSEALELFMWRMDAPSEARSYAKLFIPYAVSNFSKGSDSALVRKFFSRCRLQEFVIVSTTFHPSMTEPIAQLLRSIQWSTLESLMLTGDNIDLCIPFLSDINANRLRNITLCGDETGQQTLAQSTALFLKKMISTNPLVRLIMVHLPLQNDKDWEVIIESMSAASAKGFRVRGSSRDQFEKSSARWLIRSKSKSMYAEWDL